jgi:hypothetical protein
MLLSARKQIQSIYFSERTAKRVQPSEQHKIPCIKRTTTSTAQGKTNPHTSHPQPQQRVNPTTPIPHHLEAAEHVSQPSDTNIKHQ